MIVNDRDFSPLRILNERFTDFHSKMLVRHTESRISTLRVTYCSFSAAIAMNILIAPKFLGMVHRSPSQIQLANLIKLRIRKVGTNSQIMMMKHLFNLTW
jgi:hypothetical protein